MRPAAAAQVEEVAAYVAARAGVGVGGPRHPDLLARVADAMSSAGATSAERFRALLEHDSAMFEQLVVALTVGESYFFREERQVELLRRELLPERSKAYGPHGVLRLWSAGCAGGQEAYTLAILLEEEGLSGRARILATDLSHHALETARRGVYGKWSLRVLDEHRRRRWFRPVPGGFRVEPSLARLVTFGHDNLLDAAGERRAADMDVVLCRNVLVYLTPDAVRRVSRRLAASLAPGGWLLTASTDPHLDSVDGLEAVVTPAGVAYRRVAEEPAATKPTPTKRTPTKPTPRKPTPTKPTPGSTATARRPSSAPTVERDRSSLAPADRLAAARQALADGDYDVATERAAGLVDHGQDPTGEACVVLVRALGSAGDLAAANHAAAGAVGRFPLHVELRLLQAIVLLESGHAHEAAAAAKAALYIHPDLAMAHLTLAGAEQARNDEDAARRSYRNALAILDAVPVDQPVALADGETAGRLAALARAGLVPARRVTARATRP